MNILIKILLIILVICFSLQAQEEHTIIYPDTLYFKSGKLIPCLISMVNTRFIEAFWKGEKNTILVKFLDKFYKKDYGFVHMSMPDIQAYLDYQTSLLSRSPDTLFLKDGEILPCSIIDMDTSYIEVIHLNQKKTVMIKFVDKIFIYGYGLINTIGSELQTYLDSQIEVVQGEPEYVENPDTLYFKSGGVYPCFIEDMNDEKITIIYKDDKRLISTKLIEQIYFRETGIINPAEPGFYKSSGAKDKAGPQKAEDIYFPVKSTSERIMASIGGGLSLPTGEGSEYWNTGFAIYGDVFFPVSSIVFFGGRIAYNRWTPDENELVNELRGNFDYPLSQLEVSGSATIFEITPCLRLASTSVNSSSFKFFVQMGVGLYILNIEASGRAILEGNNVDFSIDESESKFGLNIGAGAMLDVFTIYPLYNIVITEDETTKYVSVNLGVTFGN